MYVCMYVCIAYTSCFLIPVLHQIFKLFTTKDCYVCISFTHSEK